MLETGLGVVSGVDVGIGRGVAARTGVEVTKKATSAVELGSGLRGRSIMASSVDEIMVWEVGSTVVWPWVHAIAIMGSMVTRPMTNRRIGTLLSTLADPRVVYQFN